MRFDLRKPHFEKEYFLFLLPAFFVFHGYTETGQLVPVGTCITLFVRYLLASLLLCILFFFLLGSWRKGALFTLLLLSFHFFFGSMHDAVKTVADNSFVVKYSFILPFALVVFLLLFIYLKRTSRPFQRFVAYANLLLVLLICVDIAQLILHARKKGQSQSLYAGLTKCGSCATPDVYMIIADGYAGHNELKDVFHFDNSDFENGLQKRGFHLVDSSISNYNYTPFSTASILSMNYLQGIEGRNQSKADRHICYGIINQNPVIGFFKAHGYDIRNFSVFKLDDELPRARSSFILTGEDLLTAQTFISRINRDIRFNLVTRYHFASEISKMNSKDLQSVQSLYEGTMEEAAKQSGRPRFIYTHLMMPHYPYFFDSAGHAAPLESLTDEAHKNGKAYISYLQYANKKYLSLIDQIFAHAQKPPVILLMSDHGFREFKNDTVSHQYHFMNLNAVYLPQGKYEGFYKGISAVNEFRVILNETFGQQLPLLKDSTSYLTE